MKTKALEIAAALQARASTVRNERGDLVGWLLIAVMTAALVAVVWGTLGDQLRNMVLNAVNEAAGETPR